MLKIIVISENKFFSCAAVFDINDNFNLIKRSLITYDL